MQSRGELSASVISLRKWGDKMKKIRFQNFDNAKQVMAILEKHDIEFTWDIFNRNHEIFLGHSNVDHVKHALEGCPVPYQILDYYS